MNGLNTQRILVCFRVVAAIGSGALALPAGAWADSVTGTVSVVGETSFTVQTPGRAVGVMGALTGAANRITQNDYPYVYGGGHAEAGIASVGMRGPGYNGRRVGYDCSGSVAAVLAGAGLWPAGQGVPSDAGVVSELLQARVIARGAGTGPIEVTLYDHPGVHIFMNIDGRFFGTSDGGGAGNRRGGAGWLDDGAPDAPSPVYRRYHVLPSYLRASTDAGHSVTFQFAQWGTPPGVLLAGERVQVSYSQTRLGTLVATAIGYPGSAMASGVVSAVSGDGSSLAIQQGDGSTLTFATGAATRLLGGVAVGDTVQITYVTTASGLVPVALTVTATPVAPAPAPAPVGGDGSNAGGPPTTSSP